MDISPQELEQWKQMLESQKPFEQAEEQYKTMTAVSEAIARQEKETRVRAALQMVHPRALSPKQKYTTRYEGVWETSQKSNGLTPPPKIMPGSDKLSFISAMPLKATALFRPHDPVVSNPLETITLHLPLDHEQLAGMPLNQLAAAKQWITEHNLLEFDDERVNVTVENHPPTLTKQLTVLYDDSYLGKFVVQQSIPDEVIATNEPVAAQNWFRSSVAESCIGLKRARTKTLARIHARMDYELGDKQ